jgi:phospholipid/cholesterol/gamma-HCH transport system substrate-binding protein
MKKQAANTIKLGIFVLTGLILVIYLLYILGKSNNIFSSSLELKTQFRDVNGLLVGNNVLFSGIDVGSVRKIVILNDTVIEVTMNLDNKMKEYIRNNAIASLGTDGLIGNRIVKISPKGGNAPFVTGGELIPSREEVNTQEMLQTLYSTNENVAKITEDVRSTVQLIKNSTVLSSLLNDNSLTANLSATLAHLNTASRDASQLMKDAVNTVHLASEGNGTLATLLTDTTLAIELRQAVQQIKVLETNANSLVKDLNTVTASVRTQIDQGQGPVKAMLSDTVMANQLRTTLENVEKGTAAFAQDMEALKSNFLFRRYFKKLEKGKKE